ncbi:hypothetical protein [Nitrosospira multiformis]|nr:hypothetical protein [Nitrosospira multiformis]
MAYDPQSFAAAPHLNANLVGRPHASRANPPQRPTLYEGDLWGDK